MRNKGGRITLVGMPEPRQAGVCRFSMRPPSRCLALPGFIAEASRSRSQAIDCTKIQYCNWPTPSPTVWDAIWNSKAYWNGMPKTVTWSGTRWMTIHESIVRSLDHVPHRRGAAGGAQGCAGATQLKTPYRDGTSHVIFEPLDFIARLAALVPKPRCRSLL